MNQFNFCGRLTDDPKVTYSSKNNLCAASFCVAVERDYKREGETTADFFKCVAFGKIAEGAQKYLVKGTKIIATGAVQNNNYEKDGVKHYGTQVILTRWEFSEGKKFNPSDEPTAKKKAAEDDFVKVPENFDFDMPFA